MPTFERILFQICSLRGSKFDKLSVSCVRAREGVLKTRSNGATVFLVSYSLTDQESTHIACEGCVVGANKEEGQDSRRDASGERETANTTLSSRQLMSNEICQPSCRL